MNNTTLERTTGGVEELVPYEQSLKLAQQIYAEFEGQIRSNLGKEMDGVREFKDYPNLIRYYLKKVPEDVAERFCGHGIEKAMNPLASVLNIMANKVLIGDWGKLKKSGYINAYDSSSFMIISKKDQSLAKYSKDSGLGNREMLSDIGVKKNSTVIEIGAVVVGAEYYPIVEKLKEIFPDVNIIKASEMPSYLNQ